MAEQAKLRIFRVLDVSAGHMTKQDSDRIGETHIDFCDYDYGCIISTDQDLIDDAIGLGFRPRS
jgi:hypothetical protein